MAAQRKARGGFVVSIVGLILVILGVLWVAVIFPALDKVPTDHREILYFDGTFSAMNPATQSMDSFPIKQTLDQEAVGTEDGALLIHEVRSVVNTATGADVSGVYGDESTLAIDRHTLEFVADIDERGRTGQWGPPKLLGEGDTFDLWNPGAMRPLTANYLRSEDFRDLGVVVFQIDESDINIGKEPTTGMDLYYTTVVTLWIEPSSGTVVNQESLTTTSIDMMGMKIPIQISEVNYAEETIVDMLDTGRSAAWALLWFRTVIPWVLIGVGVVMVLIDVVFLGRRRSAGETQN